MNYKILCISLLLLLATGWYAWGVRDRPEEYAVFSRPDAHYKVVVIRKKTWSAIMPGQAGDSPGIVRLYDRQGKLLRQVDVEMVQLVERVDWLDKKVSIKLLADWDLPD